MDGKHGIAVFCVSSLPFHYMLSGFSHHFPCERRKVQSPFLLPLRKVLLILSSVPCSRQFFRLQKKNESREENDVCSSVYAHVLCLIWVSTNQKVTAFYFMMKISFSYFLVGGESRWRESGREI